mgnify:CR=1 FL=1
MTRGGLDTTRPVGRSHLPHTIFPSPLEGVGWSAGQFGHLHQAASVCSCNPLLHQLLRQDLGLCQGLCAQAQIGKRVQRIGQCLILQRSLRLCYRVAG